MKKKLFLRISVVWICWGLLTVPLFAGPPSSPGPRRGFWVTSLGEKDVLSSLVQIRDLISFAKENGFDSLFVQVYRGDRAWFDSESADREPFRRNHSLTGVDSFSFLIRKAHKEGIQVHAWINVLSLSQNKKAPLLESYGSEILTKDQHGETALKDKPTGKREGPYGKEDQLFLEPGDPKVQRHIVHIVQELVTKYPELDGIHFDYIRYPAAPPYIPGARFNSVGLSYGYGEENLRRFKQATGIDPRDVGGKLEEAQQWDDWRRDQVTHLLKQAVAQARAIKPTLQLSCAVIGAFDRAYSAACQDWARWTQENLVDFVVLMNYSLDSRFVQWMSASAMALARDPKKIFIGLGAHLMARSPALLIDQMREVTRLQPGGIVLFDYEALSRFPLKERLKDSSTSEKEVLR